MFETFAQGLFIRTLVTSSSTVKHSSFTYTFGVTTSDKIGVIFATISIRG